MLTRDEVRNVAWGSLVGFLAILACFFFLV